MGAEIFALWNRDGSIFKMGEFDPNLMLYDYHTINVKKWDSKSGTCQISVDTRGSKIKTIHVQGIADASKESRKSYLYQLILPL